MDRGAPLQGGAQCPVQPGLQVEVPLEGDDMGEQVAVEGGVVIQEAAQIEGRAGGGEIGQADLSRCDDGPIALSGDPMVGLGGPLAFGLVDHGNILVYDAAVGAWGEPWVVQHRRRRLHRQDRQDRLVPGRRSAGVNLSGPLRGGESLPLSVSLVGMWPTGRRFRHLFVIGVIAAISGGLLGRWDVRCRKSAACLTFGLFPSASRL